MSRFILIIALGLATSALAFFLGGEHRAATVAIVLAAWAVVLTWGTVSVRSGLLCPARSTVRGATVSLTYDDGPDPDSTPALLDLLHEKGARATFFLIGERVRAHPELAQRIVDEGHAIGNHSQHHAPWTNFYGPSRLQAELEACQQTIVEATGVRPLLYRPPFGLVNHAVQPATERLGLELLGWTIRSWDTLGGDANRIARRVSRRLRAGDIVLLHDGRQDSERVLALSERLIETARKKNLELDVV